MQCSAPAATSNMQRRTVFVMEGLLMYLTETEVDRLFRAIHRLVPGAAQWVHLHGAAADGRVSFRWLALRCLVAQTPRREISVGIQRKSFPVARSARMSATELADEKCCAIAGWMVRTFRTSDSRSVNDLCS